LSGKATIVPKGAAAKKQAEGIEALRASIVEVAPFFADRVKELIDWSDVKVLTVRSDRLVLQYISDVFAAMPSNDP
jgi:hypothetical protein